ncbi:MAG: hypothetical protein ABIH39_02790, partial [Candidatus Margulisiibacteriota bacterium]
NYAVDGLTNKVFIETYSNSASGVQCIYPWDIPKAAKNNDIRIYIEDPNDPDVNDLSAVSFKVLGKITISEPLQGRVWKKGEQKNINWTSDGEITHVNIKYKISNLGGWTEFKTNYDGVDQVGGPYGEGANTYLWTIPNENSEDCYIRVEDYNNPAVVGDDSDNFSIRPVITITAPVLNSNIVVGSNNTNAVQWSLNGSTKISTIDVQYSVGGGAYTGNIVQLGVDATAYTSVDWNNVPDVINTDVKVRVMDVDNNNVLGESPSFDVIGSITVQKPDSGSNWKVGSTDENIIWTYTGNIGLVKIYYDYGQGDVLINNAVPVADLSYNWNPPNPSPPPDDLGIPDHVSETVIIRIVDADTEGDADEVLAESAQFKIRGGFTLTDPPAVLISGDAYAITWPNAVGADIQQVKLEFSSNNGTDWRNIDYINAQNQGTGLVNNSGESYSWVVPSDIASTICLIRITDPDNSQAIDITSVFEVRPKITINTPVSSDVWEVNDKKAVTWTTNGVIDYVNIKYSVGGGDNQWVYGYGLGDDPEGDPVQASNISAGDGTFDWVIPDDMSDQTTVKIEHTSNPNNVNDEIENFTITGKLVFDRPKGAGVAWAVLEEQEIIWVETGTILTVKLEYSVGGGAYQQIQDADSLTGTTFPWIVPNNLSTQVRLKVSNTNTTKPTIPGISDQFEIRGSLTITRPVGDEIWDVDKTELINWNLTGSISTVKLEYRHDQEFISINPNILASDQSYPWEIPNTISDDVVVRITDNGNAGVTDDSASFKIAADIILTRPLGGGNPFIVDSNELITWEKHGDITEVIIKYDTNAGLGGYPNTIITTSAAAESYNWPVPDAIGIKTRVQIKDTSSTSYTKPDQSASNFEIRGSITITSPNNASDAWLFDSQHNIVYDIHGSITSVKIEYDTENGEGGYPYAIDAYVETAPGLGITYPWQIPNTTSRNCVIKITDLAVGSVVKDISDQFTIRGGFAITSPADDSQSGDPERWLSGSNQLIQWNTFGDISHVYIEYSIDGGNDWDFVNDGTPIVNDTEQYSWTLPGVIYSNTFIKITDRDDPDAVETSDAFSIHGVLTLTQPNGQEKLRAGQSDESTKIKWAMIGPIASVDIALSVSGVDGTYTTFATNQQASFLEKAWSVPTNILSNNCFIRIRDSQDDLVEDFSNLPFKIMDNIVVQLPNGGEEWVVTDKEFITWISQNLATSVNIKYSIDAAHQAWTPVESQSANDGSYEWTIPSTTAATAKVRISDYDDDIDSYDVSDSNFYIQGRITLFTPNGGTGPDFLDKEKWGCGDSKFIQWDYDGNITHVDIHYSANNGTNWIQIDPAQNLSNNGEYEWTIPTIDTTEQALVRVRDANTTDFPTVYDVSANPFKIMSRVIVQAPNGAEVWYAGSDGTITWQKFGPASFTTVKIEYSIDDPTFSDPQSITMSTANDGSYDWLSIEPEAVSGKIRVRVSHPTDADIFDTSDNDFRVRATLTLTAPNGGAAQKLVIGGIYTISWTQVGYTEGVKLYCYKQSAPAIKYTIETAAPTGTLGGAYQWTIADFIHNDVIMCVQDPNDTDTFDISDNTFKIMPGFIVTSPNGDSKWYVNGSEMITWTYTGTVTDVGVYYSIAGGVAGSWTALTSKPASDLQWLWQFIPDEITAELKIKVGAANDADAYGVSDGDAKIRAKFTLAAPVGGEELIVGDPFTITWNVVGSVSNVDLHYTTDNFAASEELIEAAWVNGTSSGSYPWTVPDDISRTIKVRVKSSIDEDAFSTSNDLRIKGDIWAKSPVLDDDWDIGQNYAVKWGWKGSIPEVKISYAIVPDPAPGDFNPIIENYGTANDGIVGNAAGAGGAASEYSYLWTVPDEATATATIKVQDARDSSSAVGDQTDIVDDSAYFHITGYVKALGIKNPGNGEIVTSLDVGSTYNVSWEWGGTMPEVKITYATVADPAPEDFNPIIENYGIANDGIVGNAAGAGGMGSEHFYAWVIQDTISPTCTIKIADPRDETVFDDLDDTFKIQGAFTLISPAVELNEGVYECRWVTNEVRGVAWTTFGTIPKVDIIYSSDNFQTEITLKDNSGQEAANIDNINKFDWRIPDDLDENGTPDNPTDDLANNVKIRIYDHFDHEVYTEGPLKNEGDLNVDTMKIDYYNITWNIRDLVTNQPIEALTVACTSGWSSAGITSPNTHRTPAGIWEAGGNKLWEAAWSHKEFGPISEPYLVGWDKDAQIWRGDRTIYRTMETLVVHIWRAYSEFAYAVEDDRLDITSWLERDGGLVSGALIIDIKIYDSIYKIKRKTLLVDEANNKHLFHDDLAEDVKLWVGDRLGELRTMADVINDCASAKVSDMNIPDDFSGFFQQSWTPTAYTAGAADYDTLASGKVYAVVSYMGLATGATFRTPVSFTVTIPVKMADMETAVDKMTDTVNYVLDKPMSEVNTELQGTLAIQTEIIETQMATQLEVMVGEGVTAAEVIAQGGMVGIVNETMVSFEERTYQAITDLEKGAQESLAASRTMIASA